MLDLVLEDRELVVPLHRACRRKNGSHIIAACARGVLESAENQDVERVVVVPSIRDDPCDRGERHEPFMNSRHTSRGVDLDAASSLRSRSCGAIGR
jgi:murein endopeptidase